MNIAILSVEKWHLAYLNVQNVLYSSRRIFVEYSGHNLSVTGPSNILVVSSTKKIFRPFECQSIFGEIFFQFPYKLMKTRRKGKNQFTCFQLIRIDWKNKKNDTLFLFCIILIWAFRIQLKENIGHCGDFLIFNRLNKR